MDVAGDKQVEPAIAIVISKRRTRGPPPKRDTGLLRYVSEGAVVVVVVQPVFAIVGYEDIGPAVVVVVADCDAEAPAVVGHAGRRSNLGTGAVVVVVKKRGVRGCFLAINRLEGRAVEQIVAEAAIIVIVDKSHAGSICF